MTTISRPPGNPTRPAVKPTRHDFVETLKELRKWSGLSLVALEARHDILKVSTTSDYLRGVRWPRWEWVHALVTACLTHRGLTDPARIHAELAHWRTAWGHAHSHPTQASYQSDAPQASTPDPTGGVQFGTGDHEEAVDGPAGSPTVQPDPAAVTVGGDSDPTMRNASTEGAGKQLSQAAATTPERDRTAATRLRHHRWVLGAGAAVVVVAAGVVVVTTSGVFGNTNNTGSISPPPLVPGKTYTETVNSPLGARTYSKPHNLSGEWKRVPNKTDVQVSCEITAPSAPNVGLYWYRIATPPWNNQYYSPANSFLNGDPPDGSAPTHVVDQAVPECPR